MLVSLAIRDVVLIDRIELDFPAGLSVLTGETGAGKSILLDALGLALGARADAALVRHDGAPQARAQVVAEFAVPDRHPVVAAMVEHGLNPPVAGESLILRRTVSADGRSRAFVDDQPVSVAALRAIGAALVEIEGQFASHGLLDATTHRDTLDAFGGHAAMRQAVAATHRAWRHAVRARDAAQAELARARAEEDLLRHACEELAALDPSPGEEVALAGRRSFLMNAGKLAEAVSGALESLGDGDGVDTRIGSAERQLARLADQAGGRLDEAIAALARAGAETAEALALLQRVAVDLDADPTELERAEERLFTLRAAARKHDTEVDALAELRQTLERRLATLEDSSATLGALDKADKAARGDYAAAAQALGAARRLAAAALDAAIASELPPLKLDKAMFRTVVEAAPEPDWSEHGIDRVAFEVATNPGQAPGPIARITSGGELSRFMLALKVVLREAGGATTLVFDEVDAGVGGATAAAVGARLKRLAETVQVLVVTHSPQVAARGTAHWRVVKGEVDGDAGPAAVTTVDVLDSADRREEIARMLAGARITDEARAAADSLIAGERT